MKQYCWISNNSTPQCPFNNLENDFVKANAYHYDKELKVCIAKEEGRAFPCAWTDVATGCSFGRRFRTIKEALEVKTIEVKTFKSWTTKLIHLRRMSPMYHELKTRKEIYLRRWNVQDQL